MKKSERAKLVQELADEIERREAERIPFAPAPIQYVPYYVGPYYPTFPSWTTTTSGEWVSATNGSATFAITANESLGAA